MRPNTYVLMSSDHTLHCFCDEMGPLIAEASTLVAQGEYSLGDLGIYTRTHEFTLPDPTNLNVQEVK